MNRGKRERERERAASGAGKMGAIVASVQRSAVCSSFNIEIDDANMHGA